MERTTRRLPHGIVAPPVVERWRLLLYNRVPWFGSHIRWSACKALVTLAQEEVLGAAASLAFLIDDPDFSDFSLYLASVIITFRKTTAVRELWQVFTETRAPRLGELLGKLNRAAMNPPELRAFSLIYLQQEAPLENAGPELVGPLVALTGDTDALLSGRARYALAHLKHPNAVEAVCNLWVKSRAPALESVLAQAGYQPDANTRAGLYVALKFNRLEQVTACLPSMLSDIRHAAADADADIAGRARFCLANLQNANTVNAFCQLWAQTRDSLLESALTQAGYVAARPAALRLLTALKTGRVEIACRVPPEYLPDLTALRQDADPAIGEAAKNALLQLENPETRDALCQLALEAEDESLLKIAQQAAYLPERQERRALWYFLTGQFTDYDRIDFDRRILNAVYETASAAIRQRVLRAVQRSGRAEYLPILTGLDARARAKTLSPIETQLLVQMLIEHHDWERCWLLARELPLLPSLDLMRALRESGWQPSSPQETELFAALTALSTQPMALDLPALTRDLPSAIPCATLKLRGQANDLAFSPDGTQLAIGANSRRIVLWDVTRACISREITGFEHSIGRLAYTADGRLVCAERSAGGDACQVLVCTGERPQYLGQHATTLSALEAAGGSLVFSAARDGEIALWDAALRRPVARQRMTQWARAVCIAGEHDRAALLHNNLMMINLPDLTTRSERIVFHWVDGRRQENGMAQAAAFLPGTGDLLIGYFNGALWRFHNEKNRLHGSLVLSHAARLLKLQPLPSRPRLISAAADGELVFLSSDDLSKTDRIFAPVHRLKSLHVSPGGEFLATGGDDARVTLWDLRPLDVPGMLTAPLASTRTPTLAACNALLGYNRLSAPVANLLRYLSLVLQYRFRFDVLVDEMPVLQAGEFDVLIDSMEN